MGNGIVGKKTISETWVNAGIYAYLFLPVVIFFLGWIRWYIAVPLTALVVFCLVRMVLQHKTDRKFNINSDNLWLLFGVLVVAVIWVWFSGIGRLSFQNEDHWARNRIFEMLVKYDWPVVLDVETETGTESHMLVYYIAFWLPAALVGKVLGTTAGYLFQAVWAVFGVLIVWYLLTQAIGAKKVWPLVLFILFGGLDIVGIWFKQGQLTPIDLSAHIERWPGKFQFSGFTTQLYWVFNQVIYAWIIFLLIMKQKDNKNLILIISAGVLQCPLPFIGMVPYLALKVLGKEREGAKLPKKLWENIKETFTVNNVFGGGVVGLISYAYVAANVSGGKQSKIYSGLDKREFVYLWLSFFLLEAGIYMILIYKYKKMKIIYWLTGAILLACPLIKIGNSIDFGMRASIPALIVLFVMVCRTLKESRKKKDWLVFVALCLCLAVGWDGAIHEFCRSVKSSNESYVNNTAVYMKPGSEDEVINGNNFHGDGQNSFFARYLAR